MYTCTYTFTKDDFDFYTSAEVVNIRTPAFYPWQRTLLHIFLFGQLSAFLALISYCVSSMENAKKVASLAFNIFSAIATVASVGSILAFAVFSHMVEYRFYHVSVSGIYEKHRGYSYYIALAGALFYLSGLIISVAYTIKVLRKDRWAGGSQETINAYRETPQQFGVPQFSSEDQFAMRALPDIPYKYR
uniref:MARVEL domain-containing protein n=1 Tax=Heterorhabditis bacteriophora TaxID=37862 RepID=A0A1I7X2N6_HETBA